MNLQDVEIIIIDKDFKRVKAIKSFISMQWIERYFNAGEFEIHCDMRFLDALIDGQYVYRKDKKITGIIEYRQIDNINNKIMIKGRFLEVLLSTRVIDTTQIYNDTAENISRKIVADFCLTGDRTIPHLSLGEAKGLGTNLSIQRTGKTVYEAITEILNEQELAFRITYDVYTASMTFEVYKGADRTQSQNVNSWCVFSTVYYNIISEQYENSSDTRNFAYVAGAGEGSDRIIVTIDNTGGEQRRELYVDARDLQPEGLSLSAYEQLLRDRGLSKLAEYNIADTVNLKIDVNNTSFFELGDKCTYSNPALGIIAEGRVTEIYETLESNDISTNITLGKEQLDIVQKLKRSGV